MRSVRTKNVRFPRLAALLGASLLFLSLLPAGAAMAGDGKVYSPHGCMPAYDFGASDLRSLGASLQNTSSTATVVVRCPAVKDIVGGTKIKHMSVTYTSPNAAGFFCGFSSAARNQRAAYYKYISGPQTSSLRTLSLQDLTAYSSGSVYMYCYMPPGSSIHNYRIDED